MSTQTKGPIIPKEIKNVRRHLGEGGAGPVYPVDEQGWENLSRIAVPIIATNIYDRLAAESIGKVDKAWNDLLKKIYTKPTEATGAGTPAYASDGARMDSYTHLLYKTVKERALGEDFNVLEISPEEMLERFGYASDRNPEDRNAAGGYKGFQKGNDLYVSEIDPLVLAHEYVGGKYERNGKSHAHNEDGVQRDAKALLEELFQGIGKYNIN
ncbi:MAG: hypothetical protein HY831_00645 [Candidatus Aenigmarchaeota archaeon]|nr:hypothetical protein [Candidatus Aenigmarchaeota archaeon]